MGSERGEPISVDSPFSFVFRRDQGLSGRWPRLRCNSGPERDQSLGIETTMATSRRFGAEGQRFHRQN